MNLFPTVNAHELEQSAPDRRWLVEELWGEGAVGIVGGEPKCGKSFLALDLAVSVASGRPCLGRFDVRRPGSVLLFAAEDGLSVVRTRLEGIAAARATSLVSLDVLLSAAGFRAILAGTKAPRSRQRSTPARAVSGTMTYDVFNAQSGLDVESKPGGSPQILALSARSPPTTSPPDVHTRLSKAPARFRQ